MISWHYAKDSMMVILKSSTLKAVDCGSGIYNRYGRMWMESWLVIPRFIQLQLRCLFLLLMKRQSWLTLVPRWLFSFIRHFKLISFVQYRRSYWLRFLIFSRCRLYWAGTPSSVNETREGREYTRESQEFLQPTSCWDPHKKNTWFKRGLCFFHVEKGRGWWS